MRFFIFLVLCLVLAPGLSAKDLRFLNSRENGVEVTARIPFETAPPGGCIPVRVSASNKSLAPWEGTLSSSSMSRVNAGERSVTTRTDFSVPPSGGISSPCQVDLLIPLAPNQNTGYYNSPELRVSGPGISDENNIEGGTNPSGSSAPFIGMSLALHTPHWKAMEEIKDPDKTPTAKHRGGDGFMGTSVETSLLGDDWRGLSGLSGFFVTAPEFAALKPDTKVAIREWVFQGGELFFVTETPKALPRAELGLPPKADADKKGGLGLGFIHIVPGAPASLKPEDLARMARETRGRDLGPDLVSGYDMRRTTRAIGSSKSPEDYWKLSEMVGVLSFNIPLLALFIGVFALTVGPLNFHWFTKTETRHRLFWTTPLICLVASLILGVVILVHDGFGGTGGRMLLVYLLPEHKKAVVMQEQVARTGVLISRDFTLPDDVLISPIIGSNSGTARESVNRNYNSSGKNYSGDWFSSRWVQAHFLEAVQPSRAEIQLVTPPPSTVDNPPKENPPVVLSSIPGTLKELFVRDAQGHYWRGTNIRAGERRALEDMDNIPGEFLFPIEKLPAGKIIRSALENLEKSKGPIFMAMAETAPFIATLPSIRWNHDTAVYAGHISGDRP